MAETQVPQYTVVEIQRNAHWRDDDGVHHPIITARFFTSDKLHVCAHPLVVRRIECEIQKRNDVCYTVVVNDDDDLSQEDQHDLDASISDVDAEYLYEDLGEMGYSLVDIAAANGDEVPGTAAENG